jgi:short-subunit dehydrogenase
MIVFITGASSGIGRALALHYLREGHIVAAVARRGQLLASLRAELPDAAERLTVFPADVTDRSTIAWIISETEQTVGPIDLAIASAGIAEEQTAPEIDLGVLGRSLATNVCGALNALVPAAAAMRSRGRGHVVAISSLAAEQSLPGATEYCASKAALNSAMQGLDLLLRGSGVRVTTVCPGFIATTMTDGRVPSFLCVPLDRAVARILCAIRHRQRVCHFPRSLYIALRLFGLLPATVRQAVLLNIDRLMFRRASVTCVPAPQQKA